MYSLSGTKITVGGVVDVVVEVVDVVVVVVVVVGIVEAWAAEAVPTNVAPHRRIIRRTLERAEGILAVSWVLDRWFRRGRDCDNPASGTTGAEAVTKAPSVARAALLRKLLIIRMLWFSFPFGTGVNNVLTVRAVNSLSLKAAVGIEVLSAIGVRHRIRTLEWDQIAAPTPLL